MTGRHKQLRKKLLAWHYNKARGISIIDLLESGYQGFRRAVASRVEKSDIDFREAIKIATLEELERLDHHIDEERAEKMIRKK